MLLSHVGDVLSAMVRLGAPMCGVVVRDRVVLGGVGAALVGVGRLLAASRRRRCR